MGSLPYDWFPPATQPLLRLLCEHIAYSHECARRAEALKQRLGDGDVKALRLWLAALRAYDTQSQRVVSLSAKLHLAKSSRYLRRSDAAGSATRDAGDAPQPWLDWGSGRRQ